MSKNGGWDLCGGAAGGAGLCSEHIRALGSRSRVYPRDAFINFTGEMESWGLLPGLVQWAV